MTGGARVTAAGLRWTLTDAGRQVLSDADLDLAAHQDAGRAAVVKHGQHRTVYRVVLPGGDVVYWKHCRLNGPRAWWRDFFRGPKARLEFDRARALADRGIETIEPLAWARFPGRWPRGSFLVTRGLDGTEPLDQHLGRRPPATATERRRLTLALAAFVARLHAAGVTHPDLHPGNLLIAGNPDRPRFFLIDLHDVQLGRPLDREARLRNLVLLNLWFRLRATGTDRLRFWRAYAGSADPDGARRLECDTERSIAGLWASRAGRCLRESRHFRRVRGVAAGFAVRGLDADAAADFARNPDGPFERQDARLLKVSRSTTVCVVAVPAAGGPRPMVYKRFQVTHRTDYFVGLFRPPPALRSWRNGHALIDRGLPTPQPWLYLQRRNLGLPGVGYVLCDLVRDGHNLHEFVGRNGPGARRRLTGVLARWVRLMHERGVCHRDLKAANILVTAAGDCQFVDLVGMRTHGTVSRAIRVRDLARLNASFVGSPVVSRTDRLRFLRTYLNWGLRGPGDWKEWWRQVLAATESKVRRNERNNRPLA